jgi:hypothetical protein
VSHLSARARQPENYWGTEGQYRAWRYIMPGPEHAPEPAAADEPFPAGFPGMRLRTGAGWLKSESD